MTRKLVIINMSNWADESFSVGYTEGGTKQNIQPGEYVVLNPYDSPNKSSDVLVEPIKIGEANGYEPPAFPKDVIDLVEEK